MVITINNRAKFRAMRKIGLLFLSFFIVSFGLAQQEYFPEWKAIQGSKGDDEALSIIETADKGLLCVGYSKHDVSGTADAWVIKFTSDGQKAWEKYYGEQGHDFANAVIETSYNELLVVGKTTRPDSKDAQIWIMKLDQSGELLWQQTIGDRDYDEATSVVETYDKGFVVSAISRQENRLSDFRVIKFERSGKILWDKRFGGTADDEARSIVEAENHDLVVAGSSKSFNDNGDYDFYVVRLDSGGGLVWDKSYGGLGHDKAENIIETGNSDLVVVGKNGSRVPDATMAWLIRLDAEGNKLWGRSFGRGESDGISQVCETKDEKIIAAGSTMRTENGFDVQIIALTPDGKVYWNETYGGVRFDEAHSIIESSDQKIVFAGYSRSFSEKQSEVFVAKLTPTPKQTTKHNMVFVDTELKSDVDENIPESKELGINTLAVVIGIEKYRHVQEARYATNDAETFCRYAKSVFGVPEGNIFMMLNEQATGSEFNKVFSPNGWLQRKIEPGDKVIIYFSGHGTSDEDGNPYLIAHDSDPKYTSAMIEMQEVIDGLQNLGAEVLFFADACFSGLNRPSLSDLASSISNFSLRKVKTKTPKIKDNVVYLAATDNVTAARTSDTLRHGVFTYYLLKGLQSEELRQYDGEVDLEELYKYIFRNVKEHSRMFERKQIPQIYPKNYRSDHMLIRF